MNILADKKALITGGSRGIGRAITLKMASEGAAVAFIYHHNNEKARSLEEEIKAQGGKVQAYVCDASSFEAVHQTVAQVLSDFGSIDILVNNAGITQDGLMLRMTETQWDNVVTNNLKSAFNFIHACTPVMLKQKAGSIINISSVVGINGNAGQCNYAASKAAIIGLTKSIAKELGSRGIRANAIAPGYVQTDMTAALPDSVKETVLQHIALKRFAVPEDIANTALFLASDWSSYITGQVIICDGGML